MLGWAYSLKTVRSARFLGGDYRIYGAKDPRALRLLITGGSTSDSFGPYEWVWTKVLIRMLRADGYCVTGFLGGVFGYNASQEMIKVIRDHQALRPHLHISYSGANEQRGAWRFMPNEYIIRALNAVVNYRQSFFLPNTVKFLSKKLGYKPPLEGVNSGLAGSPLPAERWLSNIRTMHAISEEFKYEFLAVLQPRLGMGSYSPLPREHALMLEWNLEKRWGPFYRAAKEAVKKNAYAYDMTNIFHGKSGLFYDDCHVNEEGNQLVGEQMYLAVKKRHRELLERFHFNCE
jgi:hypothetical protein